MPNTTTENLENETPRTNASVNTPTTNPGVPMDAPKPSRKRKTPAKPMRTLEDLHNASIRSMSDAEKTKYIENLRDLVVQQDGAINDLKKTCESAFERNRMIEQKYSEFRMKANAKFQYLRSGVQNLQLGVGLLGSLED